MKRINWSVGLVVLCLSFEVFAQAPVSTVVSSTSVIVPEQAVPQASAQTKDTTSFFRIDHDYSFGLQLWAGATHPLSKNIGLSTDVFIADGQMALYNGSVYSWYGEFDIGPAFNFGPLLVTPMAGIGMDWGAKHAALINGQVYTILNTEKIYLESWVWALMYSTFKEAPSPNVFHTRDWILYKLSGTLSIGPQIEVWANMTTKNINGIDYKKGIVSMPIGGHVDIDYGPGNVLGLFFGYEVNKEGRNSRGGNAAIGRFTFIHNF